MAPIEPSNANGADPMVKRLLTLDEEYLVMDRECQMKISQIQSEYEHKLQRLLDRRQSILENADFARGASFGTPAIPNFWVSCLQNHPEIAETVFEWDVPVLCYLKNVTAETLPDPSGLNMAGFRLTFTFSANPYFANERLVKEYHTREPSPWTRDLEVTEIIMRDEIQWKDGNDVTIGLKKKEVKKKKKKKKEEVPDVVEKVPRVSFFRIFFRTLKRGESAPEDLAGFQRDEEDDAESDEEEDMMERIMDDSYDLGVAFRESVIPFAVRWFTGEACVVDDKSDYGDYENAFRDKESMF